MANFAGRRRITSYNVCYTKLLRVRRHPSRLRPGRSAGAAGGLSPGGGGDLAGAGGEVFRGRERPGRGPGQGPGGVV